MIGDDNNANGITSKAWQATRTWHGLVAEREARATGRMDDSVMARQSPGRRGVQRMAARRDKVECDAAWVAINMAEETGKPARETMTRRPG